MAVGVGLCRWAGVIAAGVVVGGCAMATPKDSHSQPAAPQASAASTQKSAETADVAEDKHGAVLCAYWIYLDVQAIGERCFPNDQRFQSTLAAEIPRIEKFIMDNAPATSEQVGQMRARMRADAVGATCGSSDLAGMYVAMRNREGELHKSVDDLLSVPRKPVLNPCL